MNHILLSRGHHNYTIPLALGSPSNVAGMVLPFILSSQHNGFACMRSWISTFNLISTGGSVQ